MSADEDTRRALRTMADAAVRAGESMMVSPHSVIDLLDAIEGDSRPEAVVGARRRPVYYEAPADDAERAVMASLRERLQAKAREIRATLDDVEAEARALGSALRWPNGTPGIRQ